MWRAAALVLLSATQSRGLRVGAAPRAVRSRVASRAVAAMGQATGRSEAAEVGEYEKYMQKRVDSGEDVDSTYTDLGVEMDFDGGDSGSGAVGDGQVTLDNQHDSPFLVGGGGQRDSVEGASAMTSSFDPEASDKGVEAAMNARDAKQKNYWGRQIGTGYADELLSAGKYEERPVLRQQLENWQNQQSLKTATDANVASQTEFFGNRVSDVATDWKGARATGRPIDQLRSKAADTSNYGSTQRLDGEEWGELAAGPSDPIEDTIEVFASPSSPGVLEIAVLNEISAFSPFRCGFTSDSPKSMKMTPSEGVMEKRESGHTVDMVIRFTPEAYGVPLVGTIVFETEDFKRVYKIVGKTAH